MTKMPLVVAEIGLNHDGYLDRAIEMIDIAADNGADFVKFQKRDVETSYKPEYLNAKRKSRFGETVRDEKHGLEFSMEDFKKIDAHCRERDIGWFVSPRDVKSADDIIRNFNPPFMKVASGSLPDRDLLKFLCVSKVPMIISTGMAWASEIESAVRFIEDNGGLLRYILHAVSLYPCPNDKVNMRRITTLQRLYGDSYKIGYSHHSKSIVFCVQAASMGCEMIEFHFTYRNRDECTDGDHKASIGKPGFKRIMDHLHNMELGWGDSTIAPYGEELAKGKNYPWRKGD